jgi:hypothetical protein
MPDAPTSASSFAAPRELLSGIDSLDLTCKVPAPGGLLAELINLKAEAGGDRRQAVTFEVGDVTLRVAATGMGVWWPVRLEHRRGQLGIGDAANRPAWRVSLSAEALHVEGANRLVAFWRGIIETLTGAPVVLMASRLDVHADFAGLDITEADRPGFVCRSGRHSVEVENGALETLYFGRGGDVTVRLYDKLAEVQASGKGGYLLGLYGEAGLRADESVQRVEAQLRAKPLRQLGVVTAEDAIDKRGAVYLYAVEKWLRLTVPGSATRRERATDDPRWSIVQAAKLAAGAAAAARVLPDRHAPMLDSLVPMVAGCAVSAGEALDLSDFAAVWRQLGLLVGGYLEDRGRDFAAEVRARLLQFGSSAA